MKPHNQYCQVRQYVPIRISPNQCHERKKFLLLSTDFRWFWVLALTLEKLVVYRFFPSFHWLSDNRSTLGWDIYFLVTLFPLFHKNLRNDLFITKIISRKSDKECNLRKDFISFWVNLIIDHGLSTDLLSCLLLKVK